MVNPVEQASGVEQASCLFQFPGGLSQQGAKRRKMRALPWVVRYGAEYTNAGYKAKHQKLSAPKAPLATVIRSWLDDLVNCQKSILP
ncbi:MULTISPECIES: hypothetical protein [unclassified Moorena]|uniref:hypothetical protein n=1 Tax=unclassified Moorena TaxID=2683338 RepID=UPI0013FEF72D|nr:MULTISPECIES: hypothetical protein [unclassified Moorena]NEO14119.1 hypothetical protein [Moorena sp. SIO3E8]NEQ00631.1 hypothetical protein [Moorena sp. SIO3F7]